MALLKTIQPPDLQYKRYTKIPFPSYHFVPGFNAHPTEHPQGHSYAKTAEEIKSFRPEEWRTNEHYLYGVDLYNYAYWWESHEAWEALWGILPKKDTTSHFLQGLIKISAAFLKWHLHEAKGVQVLFESGTQHLHVVCQKHPSYMGLDLKAHLHTLFHHFKNVLEKPDIWPDPVKNYPFINLKGEL